MSGSTRTEVRDHECQLQPDRDPHQRRHDVDGGVRLNSDLHDPILPPYKLPARRNAACDALYFY